MNHQGRKNGPVRHPLLRTGPGFVEQPGLSLRQKKKPKTAGLRYTRNSAERQPASNCSKGGGLFKFYTPTGCENFWGSGGGGGGLEFEQAAPLELQLAIVQPPSVGCQPPSLKRILQPITSGRP